MSASFRLSRALPLSLLLVLLIVLPLALGGCGLPGANLGSTVGNDPCLLQSYQGHANGNLGGLTNAYKTLVDHLDALQGPDYTIGQSADISETLQTVTIFQNTLDKQLAYLSHSTPPPPSEANPFLAHVRSAVQKFTTGSYLLAQAYLDAHDGDMRAAQDIADEARTYTRGGILLLSHASTDLANLHTDSVNC